MDWIEPILNWAKENKTFFAWIASISVFAFLLSLLLVPSLIRKIPEDYFLEENPKADAVRESHPVLRVVFLILKNLLGWIVLLSGILMLLTPGQGILTILIGIMMINFPGKRRLEIKLVSVKPLNRAINWMREKGGKPPLKIPPSTSTAAS
ncbi:MAG: PGPGW domain-containing protein [Verrucomicrobiales bacterium]|jgi:hypothetical protein